MPPVSGFLFGDAELQLARFLRVAAFPALPAAFLFVFLAGQLKGLLGFRPHEMGLSPGGLPLAAFGIGGGNDGPDALDRRGKAQPVQVMEQIAPNLPRRWALRRR